MIRFIFFQTTLLIMTSVAGCGPAVPVLKPELLSETKSVVVPSPISRDAKPLPASDVSINDRPDVSVAKAVPAVTLDYEHNVYFDFGKIAVDSRGVETLNKHAERLKENGNSVVTLIGRTDHLGSSAYNQAISEKRLDVVMQLLRVRGVAKRQIRRIALGNDRNTTARCRSDDCRKAMRRVELVYEPSTQR